MKNMKISVKLLVGFLTVTAFSIVLAAIGIFSGIYINDNYSYLLDEPIERQDCLKEAQLQFTMIRYRAANFVMETENPDIINNTLVPQYQSAYSSFQENINAYTQITNDDNHLDSEALQKNRDAAAKLSELVDQYKQAADSVLTLALAGDTAAATTILRDAIPIANEVTTLLNETITRAEETVQNTSNSMDVSANTLMVVQIVVTIVCVVLSILLAVYISRLISKPVTFVKNVLHMMGIEGVVNFTDEEYRQAGEYAKAKDEIGESLTMLMATGRRLEAVGHALETVASGDLTAELALLSERDTIGRSLKEMLDNLNDMFGEIRTASEQVSSGSGQVSQAAQGLASGSSQQAASVQELSASLAELQEKTDHNAKNSAEAREANTKTTEKLEDSIRSMGQMLDAMKSIDESSSSITKVIKVIDDIAFQTNILALNAAVEAARAGQHGKGFAVVADEVRNLAAKSAEAAKETSSLIEGSSERVKEGNEIVAKTNADLEAAVENAQNSTKLIEQVAGASIDQAKSIIELNQGMEQISTVVQANSATAEQSAAASEEMSAQAVVMNEIVAKFRLRQEAGRSGPMPTVRQYDTKNTHSGVSGFAMSHDKY